MRKIFFGIAAAAVLFCAVIFGGCAADELKSYKSEQCERLQCYADRRGRDNFDAESWEEICGLVASGKSEINGAKNKEAVNSVVGKMQGAIDGVAPKQSESAGEGAYFFTDESWEAHVRRAAEEVGADENWVESVLNDSYVYGEWEYTIRPKEFYWCVLINNQITVAALTEEVYRISREGDIYRGDAVGGSMSFWFQNGDLYLRQGEETLRYSKDDSYRLAENTRNLTAPHDIQINCGGEELNFVHFMWNYESGYGTHGVGIDVRKADEDEYCTIKVEQVWMNMFVAQFDKSQFSEGENWIRLYAVGGPTIRNDNTMTSLKNSEYALFCVTVKGDGVQVREVR